MSYHNPKQQLVFLDYINRQVDNKFINLEVNKRRKGEGLLIKKYLSGSKGPDLSSSSAYKLLWAYVHLLKIRSENLENVVSTLNITIETYEDSRVLIQELNDYLQEINLPKIEN